MEVSEEEKKPINWRIGKEKFGRIKKNQRWQKRDTGRCMTTICSVKNNGWRVVFDGESSGTNSHTIKEHDMYRFYILLT